MTDQSYFLHNSGARNDLKVMQMRARLGLEGYAIYFMILERMMEESDHLCPKDYNILGFDFKADAKKVKSVVEDFGLFEFTKDRKYFFSKSFLSHIATKDEKTKRRSASAKRAANARWEKP